MAQAAVFNHDICGLVNRIQRFLVEIAYSKSAGVSMYSSHDIVRLKKYLSALKGYKAWIIEQPQLDLPETHPRQYACDDDPVMPLIESESVRDIVRMLEAVRDELKGSQSARMPSGLLPFDDTRFTAVVSKVELFLTNYVENDAAEPLDLPESSPQRTMPPSGAQGTLGPSAGKGV